MNDISSVKLNEKLKREGLGGFDGEEENASETTINEIE